MFIFNRALYFINFFQMIETLKHHQLMKSTWPGGLSNIEHKRHIYLTMGHLRHLVLKMKTLITRPIPASANQCYDIFSHDTINDIRLQHLAWNREELGFGHSFQDLIRHPFGSIDLQVPETNTGREKIVTYRLFSSWTSDLSQLFYVSTRNSSW